MPKLTVEGVRKLKPQAQRREIPDSGAVGLYLVIQPVTGKKSWALRLRRPDNRTAKITLGRVDLEDEQAADEPVAAGALTLRAARIMANKLDRERALGRDVVSDFRAEKTRRRTAAQDRAANTFAASVTEFFADYKTRRWQTRPRHWRQDAALLGLRYALDADPAKVEPEIIKGGLAARWVDKPVQELDGHDIHAVIDEARKLGVPGLGRRNPGTSESRGRRMHAALSVFFRWLLQQRRITVNPCAGVWHPGAPPARDRTLSDSEIRLYWQAADGMAQPFAALFKLLLLTGARLREVADMTRDEVDADGIWTIPAERSKNHRPHLLPLPPMARDIISGVPVIESKAGYVFTTNGERPVSGFSKAKLLMDKKMPGVKPWRLHDVRRSTATGMAALGIAPHIVEAVLNHVSGARAGIAGVYNRHEYAAEKKATLLRWAVHVEGLTSRKSKVVALRGKKGRS